jgi:hypothetical protein
LATTTVPTLPGAVTAWTAPMIWSIGYAAAVSNVASACWRFGRQWLGQTLVVGADTVVSQRVMEIPPIEFPVLAIP